MKLLTCLQGAVLASGLLGLSPV